MEVPARLYAKTKGRQVAGSLFQRKKSYFLVQDKLIPCTNEIANALYWALCTQSTGYNGTKLSKDEERQIVNVFKDYDCEFYDGAWIKCVLRVQTKNRRLT